MASKTVLSSQPADCAFGQLKAGDSRYYIEWRKLNPFSAFARTAGKVIFLIGGCGG
jgi:hypothetical protein